MPAGFAGNGGVMKKSSVLTLTKGVVFSYLISGICLLISGHFYCFSLNCRKACWRGGIIFSYVFSCFLGGMVVSGKQEGKKYLWGLLAGILYYVILVAVSMILNREAFTRIPGVFPALFLCAFGGMLGGMTQAGRK